MVTEIDEATAAQIRTALAERLEPVMFERMVQDVLDAQLSVRRFEEDLSNARNAESQAESKLKRWMQEQGARKAIDLAHNATVTISVRHDTRITNAEEFAAAMVEHGMEPPMTEPKLDTRKLKEIAKKLPDWPGAEPFETVVLTIKIDV